jgi:hypothetical protein
MECSMSNINCMRCSLDGQDFDCERVLELEQNGAVGVRPRTTLWANGRWNFVQFNHSTGQYGYWRTRMWSGVGTPAYDEEIGEDRDVLTSYTTNTWVNLQSGVRRGYDFFSYGWSRQTVQNPTPLNKREIDHLREDLQNLLNNKKCRDLVEAILNKPGANTGIKPYSTNLMDIFGKIGTFEYKAGPYTAALGGNAGMVDAGLIKGGLTLEVNYQSFDFPQSRISSGEVLIHEMTHAAPGSGMNSYLHYQMDQAAWDVAHDMGLTRVGLSPIDKRPEFIPTPKKHDTATSPFFNNMIFNFCGNGAKR